MPRGLPEDDSLATFGGPLTNYAAVEDPSTDQDEELMNVVKADVAGMTRTAFRAWYCFLGKASSPPDEPASNVHGANWGNNNFYKPSATRTGTGVFRLTWLATITDELGVDHALNIRYADGFAPSSTLYHVRCVRFAANIIDVYVFNAAGAASDAVGVPIVVRWW